MWIVLRLKGQRNKSYEEDLVVPFDSGVWDATVDATCSLMNTFNGVYAYCQLNEISIALPRNTVMFGRRIEKLCSIASAVTTGTALCLPVFDCSVLSMATNDEAINYFSWRLSDCKKNSLNRALSYAFLRSPDFEAISNRYLSIKALADFMKGKKYREKKVLLKNMYGVTFPDDFADGFVYGASITWQDYVKPGIKPIPTGQKIDSIRGQLDVTSGYLVNNSEHREFVSQALDGSCGKIPVVNR